MLPREERLRAAEVKDVLKKGRVARAVYLSARYETGSTPLRSAAVVSKKVANTAILRNRLRRALYAALADCSGSGRAVFFIQKKPAGGLRATFSEDLSSLLLKMR